MKQTNNNTVNADAAKIWWDGLGLMEVMKLEDKYSVSRNSLNKGEIEYIYLCEHPTRTVQIKIADIVETPKGEIGIVETVGCDTVWVSANGKADFYRPEELKRPDTVKSFDGQTDVVIKAHQQSLRDYPKEVRAGITDAGEPFLTGVTYVTNKCGCQIIGNGTLQFPLSIKFCGKH